MNRLSGRFFRVFAGIVGLMMVLASCTPGTGGKAGSTATTTEDQLALANQVSEETMTALKAADFDSISTLSEGKFSSTDFLDAEWSKSKEIYQALFGSMTWKFGEARFVSDTSFSIDVELTYRDRIAAGETVVNNEDQRLNIAGILVLGFIDPDEAVYIKAISDSADVMSGYLVAELEKNPQKVTSAGTIELTRNAGNNTWILTQFPENFTICRNCTANIDPFLRLTEEERNRSFVAASSRLLSEEKITSFSYEIIYRSYGEQVEEPVESLKEDLLANEWFDPAMKGVAKTYEVSSTQLVYFFAFNEEHTGVVFEFEFYREDQTDSLVSGETIFTDRQEQNAIILSTKISEGLTKGTYGVRVRLADGAILLEDEIKVQ